ncbi:hypothetical protein [Croceimicrobium hydrocarbonivorans]|uniref:Uncharacterized protein n=1 Tax=Croceimicrobium hydrocarbonivorans TaxID=2761580 RepID=A0A7H0VB50_9FLAO|nr:hypothetical protein [Croceimicrobium hydrocarbonivorans]QNR22948.1 hypothetical protein H4K34_11220 [Croceimicrobium hydrocarbonivorans]QNR22991.1 hypothetical protein H4K34_11435 [Croceimicrobium hydrocarbonivorans]
MTTEYRELTIEDVTSAFSDKGRRTGAKLQSQQNETAETKTEGSEAKPSDFSNFLHAEGKPIDENEGINTSDKSDPKDGPDAKSRRSARLVTSLINLFVSLSCQAYSGMPNRDMFKFDPEEKTEVEDAFAEYFETIDGDISPGWMVIIVLAMILLPKAYEAHKYRQINRKSAANRKQREKEETDIEEAHVLEEVDEHTIVDLEEKMHEWNREANEKGAPILFRVDPVPTGLCKYHWYFEDRQISATRGDYADQNAALSWARQMSIYSKKGMNKDWITNL